MGDVINLTARTGLFGSVDELADGLMQLAQDIKDGEWGDAKTIVTIIEYDNGSIGRWTLARNPTDKARVAGILSYGLNGVMNE